MTKKLAPDFSVRRAISERLQLSLCKIRKNQGAAFFKQRLAFFNSSIFALCFHDNKKRPSNRQWHNHTIYEHSRQGFMRPEPGRHPNVFGIVTVYMLEN